MSCTIPVSIGELWDKYSILRIKQSKINNPEKLYHIESEIKYLEPFIELYPIDIDIFKSDIYRCNLRLWEIEDKIREKEKSKIFNEEFIELARSVYITNDERCRIKTEINKRFNSCIYEVKSYSEYDNPDTNKSVYLLSHNGLGDNITMFGAIRYLTTIYDKVYLICKKHNQKNIDDLLDCPKVITVPFIASNYQEEYKECMQILETVSEDIDILISGCCHTPYFKSRINNRNLLEYKSNTDIKTQYSCDYSFIRDFYNDIGIDLRIYYEWFDIPSSKTSLQYYDSIQNKKIVFLHTKASDTEINLDRIIDKYITDESYLIICPNKNMYESTSNNESLAAIYVNLPIRDYIDIIKKAVIIHVVNSCFSCIVYPLVKSGKIAPIEWKIYERNEMNF